MAAASTTVHLQMPRTIVFSASQPEMERERERDRAKKIIEKNCFLNKLPKALTKFSVLVLQNRPTPRND